MRGLLGTPGSLGLQGSLGTLGTIREDCLVH